MLPLGSKYSARLFLAAIFAVLVGLLLFATRPGSARAQPVGLFTTLPILWAEEDNVAGLLQSSAPQHWLRKLLEERGAVRPVDRLSNAGLANLHNLFMAQPRPLAPDENVALDAWVRGGGHVLLFADPLLTAESRFAIGDRRRPQDVVLLSPILSHWGLRLDFDEGQPDLPATVNVLGEELPVRMPGQLAPVLADEVGARCILLGDGIAAQCRIGQGRALIVADAAALEEGDATEPQKSAVRALVAAAFDH